MALREYRCHYCEESSLRFDNEMVGGEHPDCSASPHWDHFWEQMPPKFVTITATNLFMTEEAQLDSLATVYELDRILNIEAREAKETELFQDIRRNL